MGKRGVIGSSGIGSPGRSRRSITVAVTTVIVALLAVVVLSAVVVSTKAGDRSPTRTEATTSPPASKPTLSPTPTPPAAPTKTSQADLAKTPLAFYDALIPSLLDASVIRPVNLWKIAVPRDPLVALYAAPLTDEAPIAALGQTVPTVNTPTAVAVFGESGQMILVSTPSRKSTPGTEAPTAPSSTFAWARAADFTITPIERSVMVDNQTSTISIVDAAGTVSASETARLGTPNDPTPVLTATYIESIYVDSARFTQGNPVSLTGAHSATLGSFEGGSALTAIHFYPSPEGKSHGCVRVSAAMTTVLATLPIGTPVIFS